MAHEQTEHGAAVPQELELDAFRWQDSLHQLAGCASEAIDLFRWAVQPGARAPLAEVASSDGARHRSSILGERLGAGRGPAEHPGAAGQPQRTSSAWLAMLTQSAMFYGNERVSRLFQRMEQAVREADSPPHGLLDDVAASPQRPTRGQTGTSISPSLSQRLTSRSAAPSSLLGWTARRRPFRCAAYHQFDRSLIPLRTRADCFCGPAICTQRAGPGGRSRLRPGRSRTLRRAGLADPRGGG